MFEDAKTGIEAVLNGDMVAIGIGDKNMLNNAHFVTDGFIDFTFDKLRKVVLNL